MFAALRLLVPVRLSWWDTKQTGRSSHVKAQEPLLKEDGLEPTNFQPLFLTLSIQGTKCSGARQALILLRTLEAQE
jgi:hypothetical protein